MSKGDWRGIHENVAALREALGEKFTAAGIVQWLWTKHPEWEGLTPLEMIAIDRLDVVVRAAEEFARKGPASG